MATPVTLNGTAYSIPATGEDSWGDEVANYLVALSSGVLTKAGGDFTLTADANFGATAGLKAAHFSSRGTAAATGLLRLATGDTIKWRNAANDADLALDVAADWLQWRGVDLVDRTTAQTLTDKTLTGNTAANLVSGSGTLILNTSGTVTLPNATDTLVGKATADTLINKTINADSNTITNIENADIKAAAAIARSKLANGTASHVVINDGSGVMSSEATLAISRGGTGQATANAALNALLPSQTGASGKVLSSDGTDTSWLSVLSNPMDSAGDLIYGGASGVATKLDAGSAGQLLMANGAAAPTWTDTISGNKTFSGTTTVGSGSGNAALQISAGSGSAARLNFQQGGSTVFQWEANSAKDLGLYKDAGATTLLKANYTSALMEFPSGEFTWTANFNTGMRTGTNNVAITARVFGKMVTLIVPETKVTANATSSIWSTSAAAIPSGYRPSTSIAQAVLVIDTNNEYDELATAILTNSGILQVKRQLNWDDADPNCGFVGFVFTYPIA